MMPTPTQQKFLPAELKKELLRLENRADQIKEALSKNELVQDEVTSIDVLHCTVAAVCLGIETDIVDTVVMLPSIQPIPNSEQWLVGTINYQGDQVPVVDLAKRVLGLERPIGEDHFVVICRSEERLVGLLCEGTEGVCTIDCRWFPTMDRALPVADYVVGLATLSTGDPINVLSVDRVVRGLIADKDVAE